MTGVYELGQKVIFFDFLVRTRLSGEAVEDLANHWINPPTKLETEGTWKNMPYDVWIPQSVWTSRILKGRASIKESPVKLDLPFAGFIMQEVVIQDGTSDWDEYGSSFSGLNHRKAYRVSYGLRRKPVLVTPDMIREV